MGSGKYEKLTEISVIGYVREKLDFFPLNARLSAKEIGDGNLNFVYRVKDEEGGKSVIVKQSDEFARSTPEYHLTKDRSRIETEILEYQAGLVPEHVPQVFLYDEIMCCCIMEDLVQYRILRSELTLHKIYPDFAEQMAKFLSVMLICTSDAVMDSEEKKKLVKKFINPELCRISEDLVFTDPYTNAGGTNDVFPPMRMFVEEEIYGDKLLHTEVSKLYMEFKTNTQSLLHGDLHSGSVFINEDNIKIFDPEFAFYGPAGYDVGNVIGNLLLSWGAAVYVMEDGSEKEQFLSWIKETVEKLVIRFMEESRRLIIESSRDPLCNTPDFAFWYVEKIVQESAGFAGLEIIRRIVGEAHVKDVTGIEDPQKRIQAEKMLLRMGKILIGQRGEFICGKRFAQLMEGICRSDTD